MLQQAFFLAAMVSTASHDDQIPRCREDARATAVARTASALPQEIRDDLAALTGNDISDAGSRAAPEPYTRSQHADDTARFVRALRFGPRWYVQIRVPLFEGVRTITYASREGRPFERWPASYFGGPACASIRAALEGVSTPGGF